VFISERKDAEAGEQLQSILKGHSDDGDALYFLGALRAQQERYTEAVPYLTAARKQLPGSWAVCYYLGKAKLKLKQPREAVDFLKSAVSLNPTEASAYYLLGDALRSAGHMDDAKVAFDRSRDIRAANLRTEQNVLKRVAGTR
jgi:predicted Zn-dependent protease